MSSDVKDNALSVLKLILKDAVSVLRDEERSPDARMFGQRVARNIVLWDGGTRTVTMGLTLADRAAIASQTITYTGGPEE